MRKEELWFVTMLHPSLCKVLLFLCLPSLVSLRNVLPVLCIGYRLLEKVLGRREMAVALVSIRGARCLTATHVGHSPRHQRLARSRSGVKLQAATRFSAPH